MPQLRRSRRVRPKPGGLLRAGKTLSNTGRALGTLGRAVTGLGKAQQAFKNLFK
jgi:hypothetical protein